MHMYLCYSWRPEDQAGDADDAADRGGGHRRGRGRGGARGGWGWGRVRGRVL